MDYKEGDRIRVEKGGAAYEGVVMPSVTGHIVLKMVSGYNVGIEPDGAEITFLEPKKEMKKVEKQGKVTKDKGLKNVVFISTGGTIASKIDYRSGAVSSQCSADDIVRTIPELDDIANIRGRVVTNILSENMKPQVWTELARAVYEEINNGADGIVIAHGTDTMMYSAAALAFMLDTPVPVVFVGSQRSADRPSSDNVMNAICATKVAVSDIAEVCTVMHESSSDDRCAIHYATRVRKMHTSRRDAFQSINSLPIGFVDYATGKITTESEYNARGETELILKDKIEPECAIVKFTPGAKPEILGHYIDAGYKGIVIEGTGLGHVSTDWVPEIKRATQTNIPIVIASQCLHGRVCDRVYDTGTDMLKAGAIEAEDMLPEVALVKLMCVLGQTSDLSEVQKLIQEKKANEISYCSLE
ncbi:Glu-tRNA(Gln) amidotransferase subunit GatD [Methanohalophilus mahii]|uniref:Glutamyl-tRNA(Gln) amidotransferase subunit D n=1 Tax=Methanohalophilus mahii (strain ATCC 35705 / DSM 5219 / SLP) TaxID=547558 RepID=D5E6V7_METMS|nr:Glu-tRNA(Gln) amidotransferase subunit GatD [Methanohalophilus mahii]ADE36895.1 glutamyl-tRNA(Gln) amidotransferase, subunit D [Methanohalophilus mahii DSM 5219]